MNIVKYKKKTSGKYSVFLDDGRELILYEDVILKYNLLITKEISENDLLEIYQDNLSYDVYYVALKSITSRMKSIYELRLFLLKKEYPVEFIDQTIDKLIKQGYLNDRSFTKSFINTQILTTNHGPNRIRNELVSKKIDINIINEELSIFDEELQMSRIDKIIDKLIKNNKTRGGIVLKQKICNDLKLLGYEYDVIERVLSNYTFSIDKDLAKKEYDKLFRKYSSKYEGYELKRIIREKLYQKGLVYEEE